MERRSRGYAGDPHWGKLTGPFSILVSVFFLLLSMSPLLATSEDTYLLSCGSSTVITVDGRNFTPDSSSSLLGFPGDSIPITNPNPLSGNPPLYSTARVFKARSTYEFAVSGPGTHFVRLHFAPFSAPGFDLSSPAATGFQVTAMEDSVLLLAEMTVSHPSVVKEYLLWLPTGDLSITFNPSTSVEGSYAYVNAIEVFRAPDFYMSETRPISVESVAFDGIWGIQVMETMKRINAGGATVAASDDNLRRSWVNDWSFLRDAAAAVNITTNQPIMYPADGRPSKDFAPESVYASAEQMNRSAVGPPPSNLTWTIPVGSGYKYLVRAHFCDFMSSGAEALYFNVYLNDRSGYADLHPADKTGGKQNVPFYVDFATEADEKGIIRLSVGPSSKSASGNAVNAILNGLEIWKVNNSDGSLDGRFAARTTDKRRKRRWSFGKIFLVAALSVAATGLLALLVVATIVLSSHKKPPHRAPALPPPVGNLSSADELFMPLCIVERCTRGFDETLVIGRGGFGKVYRGKLRDGTRIAVKRAWEGSQHQGASQFHAEVLVLSQVHHPNLVKLLGFCDERDEMILVYEYMGKGTLKDQLYSSGSAERVRRRLDVTLSWQQRLNICIGAAKGLRHLHKELSLPVVHRDIKSTNILLGDHYVARLSDFGISRLIPSIDQTAVSTGIKGSFGYLDPEYCRTQRLTTKSDVYSFGVVLFEVLCARPALAPGQGRDEANLADWASEAWARGDIESIVDRRIRGTIHPESLRAFVDTAAKCVRETGTERPEIDEVVWRLQHARRVQIREMADEPGLGEPVPPRPAVNSDHRTVGALAEDDYQSPSSVFTTNIQGR